MLIKNQKKGKTKLDFLAVIFHYKKRDYNLNKLLKNYLKLLTCCVNLKLTDNQRFVKSY